MELVTLEKLLKESDYITLHVTLTPETRNMISLREFSLMKPTAYLINASRGSTVDEDALIDALRSNRIAGAGLDVYAGEPINSKSPLLKLENMILTPHCAGNSEEALAATSLMVSEEVVRIIHDEIPLNLVNKIRLTELGWLH